MHGTGVVGRFTIPLPPRQWFAPLTEGQGTYRSLCRGTSGLLNHMTGVGQAGASRVAGTPGYNVYIGVNQLPNFTTPTLFSATLPIVHTITPPVSGTTTFYVVTRQLNKFGLESKNQLPTLITVNSSGQQVLPPINTPLGYLQASPFVAAGLRVFGSYPQVSVDEYPADTWKVWIGSTPPLTSNPPTYTVAVIGSTFMADLTTYAPGTWYYAIALYRSLDGMLSGVLTGSVVYPPTPTTPEAVPSLFSGS